MRALALLFVLVSCAHTPPAEDPQCCSVLWSLSGPIVQGDTVYCPLCEKTWRETQESLWASCEVDHPPGTCCHAGQEEVLSPTNKIWMNTPGPISILPEITYSDPYRCGTCGKFWQIPKGGTLTLCAVAHAPGSCCHWGEREVS